MCGSCYIPISQHWSTKCEEADMKSKKTLYGKSSKNVDGTSLVVPVVELPPQAANIWSLVRELRSHLSQCGQKKKKSSRHPVLCSFPSPPTSDPASPSNSQPGQCLPKYSMSLSSSLTWTLPNPPHWCPDKEHPLTEVQFNKVYSCSQKKSHLQFKTNPVVCSPSTETETWTFSDVWFSADRLELSFPACVCHFFQHHGKASAPPLPLMPP